MKKWIAIGGGLLVLVPLLFYAGLVVHNNTGESQVDPAEIDQRLEKTIHWMEANKQLVLEDPNSMLWWMIKRSYELTGDYRLARLFKDYKKRYLDRQYHNYWRALFDPNYVPIISPDQVSGLPDYNQYFLYGLSCNDRLAATPVIQRQLSTDFCSEYHPISPACVTHQMMGLAFRQQRSCGDAGELDAQMRTLQDVVVQQLTWDPRVVDVYLQRVLMLVDTGAGQRVNERWLYRLLQAQLPSGAWSGFKPWLPVGGGNYLGFYARGIRIDKPEDDFHATAQGLLIMALLSQGQASTAKVL